VRVGLQYLVGSQCIHLQVQVVFFSSCVRVGLHLLGTVEDQIVLDLHSLNHKMKSKQYDCKHLEYFQMKEMFFHKSRSKP